MKTNEIEEFLNKKIDSLDRKLKNKEVSEEIIIRELGKAWKKLPRFKLPKIPKSGDGEENIAVVHLSDTQIGKVTSSYNSAVAEKRILFFSDKITDITEKRKKSYKIKECQLLLGGDLIEGDQVYSHQSFEIDSCVFEQAMVRGCSIIVKFVLRLLECFEKIKIIAVTGNHGRNGPKDTNSSPLTNWDNACYGSVRYVLLGNKDLPRKEMINRIEFPESDSWYQVSNVFDWKLLMTHGDIVSGGNSPWQNIQTKVLRLSDSLDFDFNVFYMGHVHNIGAFMMNRKMILVNGSTESDSDYAMQQLGVTGIPCQRLSFYNEADGLISDHPVFLEKLHASKKNSKNDGGL